MTRDAHGVPSIAAKTDLDAYFALGLAHAQDRLWQMEMGRRTASGRLSEVLGPSSVGTDTLMRTLSLYRNAQKVWDVLAPEPRAVLSAYVDGVNAGMRASRTLAPEFALLSYKPEAWRATDSLALMQLMAWQLSTNMGNEVTRSLALQQFGLARTNQLLPPVPASTDTAAVSRLRTALSELERPELAPFILPKPFVGSNSWVVAGRHTASGLPMLSNDPHLQTQIPSIWYLARLRGDRLDVAGATFPGLPFVVIGANANVAWGMTTLMADTQDLVLERIDPANRNRYLVGNEYVDMELLRERIAIRGASLKPAPAPLTITVRRTRHGPVLSDAANLFGDQTFSVRWTGDDERGGTFEAFVNLNHARDWQQFNTALASFVAPVHAFVYADKRGNIGMVAPGRFPVRSAGDGSVPQAGWRDAKLWPTYIPFDQWPREYNPARGYIVTANNNILPAGYPHHISYDWAPADRAERITAWLDQRIGAGGKLRVDDMRALQHDVQNGASGAAILRAMLALPPQGTRQQLAHRLLSAWDGRMSADSASAALYAAWSARLQERLLRAPLRDSVADNPANRTLSKLLGGANPALLLHALHEEIPSWCDAAVRRCASELRAAFEDADAELSASLGADMQQWQWGQVHKAEYGHFPFSDARYLPNMPPPATYTWDRLFRREAAAAGGDNTVNVAPASFGTEQRFLQFWGASYRQIIDLGQPADSIFMQGTGQSGNVISSNYDDLIGMHLGGRYLPFGGGPGHHVLHLQPVVHGARAWN